MPWSAIMPHFMSLRLRLVCFDGCCKPIVACTYGSIRCLPLLYDKEN